MAIHKKRAVAVSAGIIAVILVLSLAVAGIVSLFNRGGQDEINALKKRVAALEKTVNSSGASNAAPSISSTNQKTPTALNEAEYEGWLTYTNAPVGYTLRYPSDWTFQENSSELNGKPLRYVVFISPDNQYYVAFGLRKKNEDTLLTPRTGTGPGDMKTAGSITVLGTKVKRTDHIYKGKLKDVFYPSAAGIFEIRDWQGYAEFSRMTPEDYEQYDLKGTPEEKLAEKLVSSLQGTQQ